MTAPVGGRLYVVATPIGNLDDMTLRAIATLKAVPLIAAEDTRMSRRLLVRHGIDTRMVSFHARNAERRMPELIDLLRQFVAEGLAMMSSALDPATSTGRVGGPRRPRRVRRRRSPLVVRRLPAAERSDTARTAGQDRRRRARMRDLRGSGSRRRDAR